MASGEPGRARDPAAALHAALGWALSLLVPPRCGICGAAGDPRDPICGSCRAGLAAPAPPAPRIAGVDQAFAALEYAGTARDLVAALKFGRRLGLAAPAAAAIARAAPAGLLVDPLCPVPPARPRARRRGFDAADRLAAALGDAAGLRVIRCLEREPGPRQVGRPRRRRIADPPRVRACGRAPLRVVIVDDVLTTGATLAACAAALRGAGAERVTTVTLARSPARGGAAGTAARPRREPLDPADGGA